MMPDIFFSLTIVEHVSYSYTVNPVEQVIVGLLGNWMCTSG